MRVGASEEGQGPGARPRADIIPRVCVALGKAEGLSERIMSRARLYGLPRTE